MKLIVKLEAYLEAVLADLRERSLLREPDDAGARDWVAARCAAAGLGVVEASSNDYLGLAAQVGHVSRETPRVGSGASRLIQGTWPEHTELERELAAWTGLPDALLFTSGYAANVGTIGALATAESVMFSDRLNHASLIDGCRLSRARVVVVPHLDCAALEQALLTTPSGLRRWVVTESYFSMDGDGPDLRNMRQLCDEFGAWLVVDEAHALGVFGPNGAGRCAEAGVVPDVLIGTLGKSVGTQGAFVAGSTALRTWLWNKARSFVFSTAMSPLICGLTRQNVKRVRAADEARTRLAANGRRLRAHLETAQIAGIPGSFGPIVALPVGPARRALEVADALRARGVLAQAIRPPTVPEGLARIRVTVTAQHSNDDIDRVAAALVDALARN